MHRLGTTAVAVLLVLALLPGVAAADTRVGGTVVVAEGETVDDVTAVGGTIVVYGTVAGDLEAYGGDVRVAEGGTVEGRLRAYGGDVRIDGTVDANALAYGGSVTFGETARIDRALGAFGGDVTLAGNVGGDVTAVAGSITLAETASIEGDLYYQGQLTDAGGAVDGVSRQASDLHLVPSLAGPLVTAIGVYLLVVDLVVGAILLYAAPRFAADAARQVSEEPLRTAGLGLAAVIAVLLAAILLAITVVGLPVALALLAVAVVLGWIANVYGRYTVGAWVLSYSSWDNRYLALLLGVVGVAILGVIPYLGGGLRFAVFLVGAGVIAAAASGGYQVLTADTGHPPWR